MEKRPSILVVDDDEDICLLLHEIFRSFNISSSSVLSITSAKSIIYQLKPTHIILDNNLPDGDGISFTEYLSNYHPDIKITLLTGDSEINYEGIEGILDILLKPFTKNSIKEAFKDLIPQIDVE